MTNLYYQNAAAGTGDGSTWANRRAFSSFAADYASAQPGDSFFLGQRRYEQETYLNPSFPTFNISGTAEAPIEVCGVNVGENGSVGGSRDPKDYQPIIKSDLRGEPYSDGRASGSGFFAVSSANYARFENMFLQGANRTPGAFTLSGSITGAEIHGINAYNVGRVIECSDGLVTNGLTIADCWAVHCSRGFARFQGSSNNMTIRNVYAHMRWTDDDSIIQAFQHQDSDTNVLYDNCHVKGSVSINKEQAFGDANEFFQGDGYNAEAGCSNFTYNRCSAEGCTDGGWDNKAANVVLNDCWARSNKRHYRFWNSVTLNRCRTFPTQHKRANTNTTLHLNMARNSTQMTVNDSYFQVDEGTDRFLEAEGSSGGALFTMNNCRIDIPSSVVFATGAGTNMILNNVDINGTIYNGNYVVGTTDVTGY